MYAALYARYEEGVGDVITSCLYRQLGTDESGPSSSRTGTGQYPRPGGNTITGKVWKFADQQLEKTGVTDRASVVAACVEEGINENTANTQYSHWKKSLR